MKTLLIFITTIMSISCNTVKKTFTTDLESKFAEVPEVPGILSRTDAEGLPIPLQRYLEYCGYYGKEYPWNAEVVWSSSHIKLKPGARWTRLKTLQFNSVEEPFRIAYMKARVAGIIPFEGRDMYYRGQGHMLGKLGKVIPIFDEKDKETSQSALIVVLAEAPLVPGYLFRDYIRWESIDDDSVRGTIEDRGIHASGIFYFNEKGEYTRFETSDRNYMDQDKSYRKEDYTVLVWDYREGTNGIKHAGKVSATWNLPGGDHEYWKGSIEEVRFNVGPGK